MAVEKVKAKTVNEPALWIGLSNDTKPTTDVDSGDTFWALDTKKAYMYSAKNTGAGSANGWWEV